MDIKAIVNKMTREQKVRLCTGKNNWQTTPVPGLGIPSLVMSDGTSGMRFQKDSTQDNQVGNLYDAIIDFSFDNETALKNTYEATCFPSGSALACSWNPGLASEIGGAIATECKSAGVGLLLGPGMNIRRHPLTARNFEYYSEDPVLSGDMAAGMVEGIQGGGVGATLKHFACNNSDTRRTKLNCIVEERALREIYLAGFERAVKKAKPAAVMGSYPAVNGVQACESKRLLSDILRDEWGFEGITVSDWGGVKDSVAAAKAGLDLQMPQSRQYLDTVTGALDSGALTGRELDVHCERLLRVVFEYSRDGKGQPQVDWTAHHGLAQTAAAECAVLLRNEGPLLPLDPEKKRKIAVLGGIAKAPLYQGTGCAVVRAKQVDVPFDELQKAAPAAEWLYAEGYTPGFKSGPGLLDEAVKAAKDSDVAIVMVGSRLPLESDEYDRPDMNLEDGHLKLVEAVCAAQPNTVVVVFNGDAVAMPWAENAAAVLDMWYSGEGSGNAVAKLLFGGANPSGKLAVTIPRRLEDTPAYLDFPHEQDAAIYREGVFVGYRYYDARKIEPLYPFGFGLSYTAFSYDEMTVERRREDILVKVRVTNTGKRFGGEVVQLYVAPHSAAVFRPGKELKAFAKLFLNPGESKEAEFVLADRDFSCYNDKAGSWCLEAGDYQILAGSSSRNIHLSETVAVQGGCAVTPPLQADSHYTELLGNPAAAKEYFAFLVENGLLEPDQVIPELPGELKKTFWGFSQHLDMLAGEKLSPKALEDLLDRMNRAVCGKE